MLSISCGHKIAKEELRALTQPERKRLNKIVHELMRKDRYLTRAQAIEKADPLVLAESVPF